MSHKTATVFYETVCINHTTNWFGINNTYTHLYALVLIAKKAKTGLISDSLTFSTCCKLLQNILKYIIRRIGF